MATRKPTIKSHHIDQFITAKVIDYEQLTQPELETKDDKSSHDVEVDITPDLQFLEDYFYTFQPEPPPGKKFFQLKKIVYSILFKYTYRQVKFNDHLRVVLRNIVKTQKKLHQKINELDKKFQNISSPNPVLSVVKPVKKTKDSQPENSIELHARLNAMSEMISQYHNIDSSNYPLIRHFYAQYAEDRWLADSGLLPDKGYFVDIGASDGITFSNTFLFEKLGWTGYCIEPDPRTFSLLKKYRQNPLNYAIGSDKSGDYYLSAISPELSGFNQTSKRDQKIEVKTISLANLIKQKNIKKIDLLSLDTEGTELEIWKDFRKSKQFIKPKVVIVEYMTQGTTNTQILKEFENDGYSLVHLTNANYIFVGE